MSADNNAAALTTPAHGAAAVNADEDDPGCRGARRATSGPPVSVTARESAGLSPTPRPVPTANDPATVVAHSAGPGYQSGQELAKNSSALPSGSLKLKAAP